MKFIEYWLKSKQMLMIDRLSLVFMFINLNLDLFCFVPLKTEPPDSTRLRMYPWTGPINPWGLCLYQHHLRPKTAGHFNVYSLEGSGAERTELLQLHHEKLLSPVIITMVTMGQEKKEKKPLHDCCPPPVTTQTLPNTHQRAKGPEWGGWAPAWSEMKTFMFRALLTSVFHGV